MRCATGVSAAWSASGAILDEAFLKPLGLTVKALGKTIGVPPNRITGIPKNERGITGVTTIRRGTFFKTSAEFGMNLRSAEKPREKKYR
jgi:addiction module HigA family antidote